MSELYEQFTLGRTFSLDNSNDQRLQHYAGVLFQTLASRPQGVLANRSANSGKPILFIPLDGRTSFRLDVVRGQAFDQVLPNSQVWDVELQAASTMQEFLPSYFDNPIQAPVPVSRPDWWFEFEAGTIFLVHQCENPYLQKYVGVLFSCLHATQQGVLARPATGQGLGGSPVYLPFAGLSFTMNPFFRPACVRRRCACGRSSAQC